MGASPSETARRTKAPYAQPGGILGVGSRPWGLHVLNDNEEASKAELETENRNLRASLSKCQALVAECRERLAAETAPPFAADQQSTRSDTA